MTISAANRPDRTAAPLLTEATGWLALAAAPTFAVMALVSATGAEPAPLCSVATGGLPIDGMTAMYLLMSLFHLPAWLRIAAARLQARR